MDKMSFLHTVGHEDKNMLSSIFDKIELAKRINNPVFTGEFYPPNIWVPILNNSGALGIGVNVFGVFENSERRVLCFSDLKEEKYPIQLLKVIIKSAFDRPAHKDYLGAIMALGIKREKFGDLLLIENSAYISVMNDIASYICDNLQSVGKAPCTVERVKAEKEKIPDYNFENIYINVSSMRIDDVCSALCNTSRSKAVELLRSGKVLVNYIEIYDKSFVVKVCATLTIRGIGKFKISEEISLTNKGRMRVNVKKYV